MMKKETFPFHKQLDSADCGPACLKMISSFHGRNHSLEMLRERCGITRVGVTMLGISEAAESIGFRTTGVRIDFEGLTRDAPFPCVVHWRQRHFIVVYRIRKERVYAADPGFGLIVYSREEFMSLNLHELDDPESAKLITPRIQQLMETGETSFEVRHYRKDRSTFPLLVNVRITDWGGKKQFSALHLISPTANG